MYILLAEDDVRLGKMVVHMLKKENHVVDWVQNGEDAYYFAKQTDYDLLILDWMMPIQEGTEVCRTLRNEGFSGAILMLTARDALEDRVTGLDLGADDYIVKPFEFSELFARIRALSRRATKPFQTEELSIGNLTLNLNGHSIKRGEKRIQLTNREFQLMELFMRNPNQILPRELIIERIWGLDADITSNNIDSFIRLLRKKLGDDGTLIQNIRGVGYKLSDERQNV
ncbi:MULTISPECIES: response regulator transcription factor [Anoxybacillaceae]|jgi:DNA-binding response OmpR family regulator|uniref:Response regulator transcription factor n=1 Tax=Anoxybacillus flavithermus TaxID=33934 RepID=A0A178T518_9BACL|nr:MULTISPECIES: response regulator transcription factor [Bacillaceae]ASA95497.1 DNA-binding response regulator [Anoxybacillus flavithermus]ELK22406.1 two-component system, response regulator [Anoxybacillus flavithermus TNO-09.006]MBE2905168.1 response regulator transcription factor [Anoxybacillus flavithermus]MBE2907209.1 response regulator transcription factor [Anoxybacillus flavithermus]MBE2909512.1 response regulator transcription factor [Anoxybacillus flavithermus]